MSASIFKYLLVVLLSCFVFTAVHSLPLSGEGDIASVAAQPKALDSSSQSNSNEALSQSAPESSLEDVLVGRPFPKNGKDLSGVLAYNRQWSAAVRQRVPDFFSKLAKSQSPNMLWIGCSDSRVPPNQVTQLRLGEMFIHRNIANVILNSDMNSWGVIQYAVDALKVPHIVVAGHYNCGGCKAALEDTQNGLVDNWVRNIKDVYMENSEELDCLDSEERFRKLVEYNAMRSAKMIANHPVIQEAWARGQPLSVHAWVYDVETGLIKDLNRTVNRIESVEEIYRMKTSGKAVAQH
ncbi:uncharacterized protein VTP21DRAFT_4272 [Calcarisporiella thermophila]|uniref:uncharacterized protein n=1 Tax=Calcarisporiella thermophila TaxID=911321 RepID=UPI0037431E2F